MPKLKKSVPVSLNPFSLTSILIFVWLTLFAITTFLLLTPANAQQNRAVTATPASLSGLISTGDGTWFWHKQQTQGNQLNGLSCPAVPDNGTCYGVGNSGTLIKTTDGGITWVSQNPTTVENLTAISCFDVNNCMAVGDKGVIIVTSDGGAAWTRKPVPGNSQPQTYYGVSCPALSTCYVTGYRSILAITNAGSSWLITPQSIEYYAVACPAGNLCFAVGSGGKILKTQDSGHTWAAQTVNNNPGKTLLGLSCVTTTICYAVGGNGTILKTTDGSTWNPLTGTGISSSLYAISCISSAACTAVGGGSYNNLLTTTDSGATWQSQETYAPTLYAINCLNQNVCYAAGDSGTIISRKSGLATWHDLSDGSLTDFTSVACPTNSYCLATKENKIFSTVNAGGVWSQEYNNDPQKELLIAIACADSANCAAVGQNGRIVSKVNNGAWQAGPQFTGGGFPPNFTGVACYPVLNDKPTCYATGASNNSARIFKSTDGGNSYTAAYSPPSGSPTDVSFQGISCPVAGTCYAVGSNGVILKGGNTTWNQEYTGTSVGFAGISCPDVTTCYSAGQNVGDVWKTADSGTTWDQLGMPQAAIDADLNGISCTSQQVCHAVGNAGGIVTTIDGGRTWIIDYRKPDGPVVSQSLASIACPSNSFCLAVGSSGKSVTSSTADLTWQGQSPQTRQNLFASSCLTSENCFIAGSGVTLVNNSSPDWHAISAPNLNAISCPGLTTCFAPLAGSTSVLMTQDGGVNWSTVNMGAGADTISCPSTNNCYAGSSAGVVLTYNSGSWQAVTIANFSVNILGISCPTGSNICYAVGNSSDFGYLSGGNWVKKPLGATYNLQSISCPDTNTCYGTLTTGGVLATKNGGSTWSAQNTGLTTRLNDISCPTTTECVAVGYNGEIVSTRDGGQSWHRHESGTNASLNGVNCDSVDHCVAVGDSGTILIGSIIQSLNVTSATDNSQGTTFGTLSYALKYARTGQTLSFDPGLFASGIALSGGLPQVAYGVNGLNLACSGGPVLTISSLNSAASFSLGGNITISGIRFKGLTLKTPGQGNKLSCVNVTKV